MTTPTPTEPQDVRERLALEALADSEAFPDPDVANYVARWLRDEDYPLRADGRVLTLAAVSAAAPDEREATPDEAHDIGYTKGHTDGYREAMAALAARPAPVVSGADVARAVSALTASRVAWGSRSIVLRADEARALLDTTLAALGITVADAPAADDEGGQER